jgi:hypothetical protein
VGHIDPERYRNGGERIVLSPLATLSDLGSIRRRIRALTRDFDRDAGTDAQRRRQVHGLMVRKPE